MLIETRDRRAIAVYVAIAALVGGLLAVQTAQEQFSGDVFMHLAVVRELSANPFEPVDPFVAGGDTTFYFSPYTVGLGLLGKFVGGDPLDLLNLGAVVNLILLMSGFWFFSRSFSSHRWTPHLTLFFSLLAWGFASWRWSGFWSLNSIGFGLGYPSMFAGGLSLLALSGLRKWFSSPPTWMIIGAGCAAALIGVTHQFTALWFAIAAVAIVGTQPLSVLRDRAPWLLVTAVLAITLALLWPYYSLPTLLSTATESAAYHVEMYRLVLQRGLLLLPGVAAVVLRARQNWRDPLLWMFIGGISVYIIGYMLGAFGLGRVLPLVAISTHVALADLFAGWMTRDDRRTAAWLGVTIIGVAGLVGSALGLVRMIPRALLPESMAIDGRLAPVVEPYASLSEVVQPTNVAFASEWMSRVVPAMGGRVVVPWAATPQLSDRPARERDSLRFFSSDGTSEYRAMIAERWGATLVVVQPSDLDEYAWLLESYRVVAETDAYIVLSLAGR